MRVEDRKQKMLYTGLTLMGLRAQIILTFQTHIGGGARYRLTTLHPDQLKYADRKILEIQK